MNTNNHVNNNNGRITYNSNMRMSNHNIINNSNINNNNNGRITWLLIIVMCIYVNG